MSDDFDEDGTPSWYEYKLSDEQRDFVDKAESEGYEIYWCYSGRGMYGRECPSIDVEKLTDFSHPHVNWDNMGLEYVIYCSISGEKK